MQYYSKPKDRQSYVDRALELTKEALRKKVLKRDSKGLIVKDLSKYDPEQWVSIQEALKLLPDLLVERTWEDWRSKIEIADLNLVHKLEHLVLDVLKLK